MPANLPSPRLSLTTLLLLMLGLAAAQAETAVSAAPAILIQDSFAPNGGRYAVDYIKVLRNGIEQPVPAARIGDTVSLGVHNLGLWIQLLMEQGVIQPSARLAKLQEIEKQ